MKLQSEFKRDIYSSYMVVQALEDDRFEARMLSENKIEGIMNMQIRNVDNVEYYYYDISSKQPIANLFERGQLGYNQIRNIILGLLQAIEEGNKYLLDEKDYVLDTEYIYISLSNFSVSVCYFPGYSSDISRQFVKVIEYLMDKADHTDEKAVMLVYSLYKVAKQECSLGNIKKVVEDFQKEQFTNRAFNTPMFDNHIGSNNEYSGTASMIHSEATGGAHRVNIDNHYSEATSGDYSGNIGSNYNGNLGSDYSSNTSRDYSVIDKEENQRHTDNSTDSDNSHRNDEKVIMNIINENKVVLIVELLAIVISSMFLYKKGLFYDLNGCINYMNIGLYSICSIIVVAYTLYKLNTIDYKSDAINRKENVEYNTKDDIAKYEKISGIGKNDFFVKEEEEPNTNIYGQCENIDKQTGEIFRKKDEEFERDFVTSSYEEMPYNDTDTVLLSDYRKKQNIHVLKAVNNSVQSDIVIEHTPWIIGKLKENVDCVISDEAISRIHAKLDMIEGNQMTLTDLNSKNGTYINGERMRANETRKIQIGDEIGFADLIFNLR